MEESWYGSVSKVVQPLLQVNNAVRRMWVACTLNCLSVKCTSAATRLDIRKKHKYVSNISQLKKDAIKRLVFGKQPVVEAVSSTTIQTLLRKLSSQNRLIVCITVRGLAFYIKA